RRRRRRRHVAQDDDELALLQQAKVTPREVLDGRRILLQPTRLFTQRLVLLDQPLERRLVARDLLAQPLVLDQPALAEHAVHERQHDHAHGAEAHGTRDDASSRRAGADAAPHGRLTNCGGWHRRLARTIQETTSADKKQSRETPEAQESPASPGLVIVL